jgi:hypothetical protein
MIASKELNNRIQTNILGERNIKHSTSYPVIYKEKNEYYLAVFVFLQNNMSKPSIWAIIDFETGEILARRDCKNINFSDIDYDTRCAENVDIQFNKYNVHEDYYNNAFSILDTVRNNWINNGKFYKNDYRQYLYKIISNTPTKYQQFYFDLSV